MQFEYLKMHGGPNYFNEMIKEESLKRKGSSIIFVNDEGRILLFLRDNKSDLPYPNMWDVPGGHVEADESPEKCITREMKEEMALVLDEFELFSKIEFEDRIEYTFWARADLDIDEIKLTEGQQLKWFTRDEAKQTQLAYGFNEIVERFYSEAPFFRS
jgi:8-oxo-dGTP diphosphatase